MAESFEFEAYRRSYLPLCACNAVISLLSVGMAARVAFTVYFPESPIINMERFVVWLGLLCAGLVFSFNFLISTGRKLWLRLSIGTLLVCLVIVIPAVAFEVGRFVYVIALFFPVLGLLSFNSRLHRSFCKTFAEYSAGANEARVECGANHGRKKRSSLRIQRRKRASRREIAISNRNRDLAEKIAAHKRRRLDRVFYRIDTVVVGLLMCTAGFMIYDSISSGYVLAGGRGHPIVRFSLANQPGMFWFYISLYAFLIVVGGVFLRVMHLLTKPEP